jgi:hypothetical protein
MGNDMELRSFLAGILFLYGVETMLPFFGIKVALVTPNPLVNLTLGAVAVILAYYLFRN